MSPDYPWYADGDLHFAVGIEDTFLPFVRSGERGLDEYELTGHYRQWHADLGLAAESGATMIRWGIPWYRINPAPGEWAWEWLDRVVDRLEEIHLVPIVDLVHYGTPAWLSGQFLNPRYPASVADYAARVAERYKGRLTMFTPLNEPFVTALNCGQYGYWPPYLHGDAGFLRVAKAIARGIVRTQHAIDQATEGEASFVHVEASVLVDDPSGRWADRAQRWRGLGYLIQDLVTGRVGADHELAAWLAQTGFTIQDEDWFQDNGVVPDVIGVNYYPLCSSLIIEEGEARSQSWYTGLASYNTGVKGLETVLRGFADRYGRPVLLAETSWAGSVADRLAWLDDSVTAVRAMRKAGVPVVGYTWWSVFDMIDWTYMRGAAPLDDYLLTTGLWDLVSDGAGGYARLRNPVADRFAHHATDFDHPRLDRAAIGAAQVHLPQGRLGRPQP